MIETDLIENILQAFLCQRRTLNILDGTQLPRESLTLLTRDGSLFLSLQLFHHLGVVPKIDLSANDEARDTRTMMMNLWEPFLLYVLK